MHGRLGILIEAESISGLLAVDAATPRTVTYTSEDAALREFGDFVGGGPAFTSLEVGVLNRGEASSEFLAALLDIGFNVTVLNPQAVEQFSQSRGGQLVTPGLLVDLLRESGL
jgi:hypothetical protein